MVLVGNISYNYLSLHYKGCKASTKNRKMRSCRYKTIE